METSSLAERLTSRFVAGQTLDRALTVCRKLNDEGILVTLDHLGENVTSPAEAKASRDAYLEALRRVSQGRLRSTVSIKLTQFGLDLSSDGCRENVEQLVCCARQSGTSVEIDMEASEYVDRTLEIVRAMHAKHGSVRAVIQAYLRRSENDIEQLCRERIPVRLCKGAYQESADIAFPRKSEVDENYVRLTRILMERGVNPGIASHDPNMVEAAVKYASELGVVKDGFEFQMLYGIRRDLQRWLVKDGYRLRLYVPYGDAWYPYLMRRLAERPANLLFLARNLLRR